MILSVLRGKKNQWCTLKLGQPLASVVSMVRAGEMAGERIDRSAIVWHGNGQSSGLITARNYTWKAKACRAFSTKGM